jgi:serine protease Do
MNKTFRRPAPPRAVRCILAMICLPALVSPSVAQMPELSRGKVPTLAPLVREVTPSVVNISAQGRVKEDNTFYRDPLFREYFDVPEQLERKIHAVGSGVIVDAQRGYVLTANHVVAQVSTVQVTTKEGRSFVAKLMGRDPGTDLAVLRLQSLSPSRLSPSATAIV